MSANDLLLKMQFCQHIDVCWPYLFGFSVTDLLLFVSGTLMF